MVQAAIRDGASARAWLETQPHQVRIWFAARWALRVAPVLFTDSNSATDHLILMSLRALLTASVAATCSASEFDNLEQAASAAARAAGGSVIRSAVAAAEAGRTFHNPNPSDPLFVDDHIHSDQHSAAQITAKAASTVTNSLEHADTIMRTTGDLYHITSPVFPAAVIDTGTPREWRPLWPSKPMAEKFLSGWESMKRSMQTAPEKWAFWLEWYEAILRGNPLPWDLSLRIAKEVTEEQWDAGPETVAERIEEIRREFEQRASFERPDSVPELERQRLAEHVTQLLANPKMTAIAAQGTAETLDRAIREFLDKAPANCLPDELIHLQDLPPVFRQIAEIVTNSATTEAKERRLAEEIEALNQKVAQLEAHLKEARGKTLNGRFKTAAIESLGKTIGGPWFIGAVAFGTCHFFGVSPSDLTLENLRGWLNDVNAAEPMQELAKPPLPPTRDV
ncbi:hypothetical protein I5535_04340 [Rhodobacteraceae bacterium F11138]|nr:hypothetical protein [Rhodobacteraceae bacterium F11138]